MATFAESYLGQTSAELFRARHGKAPGFVIPADRAGKVIRPQQREELEAAKLAGVAFKDLPAVLRDLAEPLPEPKKAKPPVEPATAHGQDDDEDQGDPMAAIRSAALQRALGNLPAIAPEDDGQEVEA